MPPFQYDLVIPVLLFGPENANAVSFAFQQAVFPTPRIRFAIHVFEISFTQFDPTIAGTVDPGMGSLSICFLNRQIVLPRLAAGNSGREMKYDRKYNQDGFFHDFPVPNVFENDHRCHVTV